LMAMVKSMQAQGKIGTKFAVGHIGYRNTVAFVENGETS